MQSQKLLHLHIIISHGEHVLSNQDYDKSFLEPNNHIEADTHLFLHLADAVRSGHSKAFMRTLDSDILVLATALFKRLVHLGLTHLWIGFGKGKTTGTFPFMIFALECLMKRLVHCSFFMLCQVVIQCHSPGV